MSNIFQVCGAPRTSFLDISKIISFLSFLRIGNRMKKRAREGGEGEEFQGSRILLKKAFVFPLPSPPSLRIRYSVFISRVSRVEGPLSFISTEGGRNKGPIYRRGERKRERSRNDTFAAKLKATQVGLQGGLEAAVGSVHRLEVRPTFFLVRFTRHVP